MDYPKFYEIEGQLVVITMEDNGEFGRLVPTGQPYPPFKAVTQGDELGRTEFLEKLKERYPDSKMAAMF